MTLTIAHMQPIVSLLAGILILIMPRLLNYIVAILLDHIGSARARAVSLTPPRGQGCSTLFIEFVEQHGRGILSDG